MNSKKRKVLAVAFLLIITTLYFVFGSWLEKGRRMENPTSFSDGPFGLSQFMQYRLSHNRPAVVLRRAFLQKNMVGVGETVIIGSAQRPISSFETNMLLEDVIAGANVYLSAHSDVSYKNLNSFLSAVAKLENASLDRFLTVPDKFFEQQRFSFHDSSSDGRLVKSSDKYAFYSAFSFTRQVCKAYDAVGCYIQEMRVGKGTVWLQLGAPLFANAMLGQEGNRIFAARLSEQSSKIIFDEYHQFYEESDLGDFLSDPTIMLPLLGFVLICLLAAGMSDLSQHLPVAPLRDLQKRDWSQMTVGLLRNQLRYPAAQRDAILLQCKILLRNYPELREAIEPIQLLCNRELRADKSYYQNLNKKLKSLHQKARMSRGAKNDD